MSSSNRPKSAVERARNITNQVKILRISSGFQFPPTPPQSPGYHPQKEIDLKQMADKRAKAEKKSVNLYHNKDEVVADHIAAIIEDEEDEDYEEEKSQEDDSGDSSEESKESVDSEVEDFIVDDDTVEYDDAADALEIVEKELTEKEKEKGVRKKVVYYYGAAKSRGPAKPAEAKSVVAKEGDSDAVDSSADDAEVKEKGKNSIDTVEPSSPSNA